ncbi:MAG TPA: DUF4229 domain-containing protein [Mycobacteriales bacterium]|nr:DUF4229 domain-containing protein [Mycobacteriales bacterium]
MSEQPDADGPNGADARGPSGAKAVLVYNLMRLGLLAACLAIGWFAGVHNLLFLCAGAFLVSGVISWFALKRQRINMGVAIERTVERGRTKMAERTAAEDEYADAVHANDDSTAS